MIKDYTVLGEHETGIMIFRHPDPSWMSGCCAGLTDFFKKGVYAVVREISYHAPEKPGRFYIHIAEPGED